jgi:hypothetical protein
VTGPTPPTSATRLRTPTRRCGGAWVTPCVLLTDLPVLQKQTVPRHVAEIKAKVSEMSLGWDHMCAVDVDGRLYSWGVGTFGQLGHGDAAQCVHPRVVESMQGQRVAKVRSTTISQPQFDDANLACRSRVAGVLPCVLQTEVKLSAGVQPRSGNSATRINCASTPPCKSLHSKTR